ncbi:MAG: hypothetical protein IJ903_02280 [Ruminococcus sp.]|nr:hypothetical protein [Ruminococcus sp.]
MHNILSAFPYIQNYVIFLYIAVYPYDTNVAAVALNKRVHTRTLGFCYIKSAFTDYILYSFRHL